MVTAETAMVLPTLVLITLVAVAAVAVGQAQVRCADAAREAARAIARGDPGSAATLAQAAAGRAVQLRISSGGADTTVTVGFTLRPVSWLSAVKITETAVVATEPAVTP